MLSSLSRSRILLCLLLPLPLFASVTAEAAAIVNGNAYAGISECENVILTKEDYAAIGKVEN